MSDQPSQPNQPNRDLSEISHLFLSSIREKAGNGSPPPKRRPPGQHDVSMDLTPEEYAQVMGAAEQGSAAAAEPAMVRVPEVTAVIGSHLNGRQFDRVKEYARHLTTSGQRIGLIEVDASEFRVMCFEPGRLETQPEMPPTESFDPRRMTEALNELSCDVDRWLLVLPAPRTPEARGVLREVGRWVLLCTSDHDGVVSAYRTLKGLTDLWPATSDSAKPRLSLALLDAVDEGHADRIFSKLSSVCRQFLCWPLEAEPFVRPSLHTSEHLVLCCRPTHDKTQVAAAPQWQIMLDLIARSKVAPAVNEPTVEMEPPMQSRETESLRAVTKKFIADVVVPSATPAPVMAAVESRPQQSSIDSDNVLDLPNDADDESILRAVLKHRSSELIECPIAPPMCPGAKLAVGRDHRVMMLAVAHQGLGELPAIGQAFRWLEENRSLIGMAVPQLAIDTAQPAQLSLLIDRADSSAQLRPILQTEHVTVQTYRTLRWSGRRGLLLEAA